MGRIYYTQWEQQPVENLLPLVVGQKSTQGRIYYDSSWGKSPPRGEYTTTLRGAGVHPGENILRLFVGQESTEGRIYYDSSWGRSPPREEYTTTVRGVNYQQVSVALLDWPNGQLLVGVTL